MREEDARDITEALRAAIAVGEKITMSNFQRLCFARAASGRIRYHFRHYLKKA